MWELMESLEYVRAYLDDLLCIPRNSLEDHLEKLEEVLRWLCNAGLKVNAEKLTFCTLEIKYPGYILTRDGIKPQSNKVQVILASTAQRSKTTPTFPWHGAIEAKHLPLSPHWLESAIRPKWQKLKEPKRCLGITMRSIKELSIT